MSVLVASKKLKRAISTIDDYDLPDDPGLREISAALSEWLSKNLITDQESLKVNFHSFTKYQSFKFDSFLYQSFPTCTYQSFSQEKSQLETCERSSHSALSPTISASKLNMIALVNHLEKYFIILLLLLVSNWDSIQNPIAHFSRPIQDYDLIY